MDDALKSTIDSIRQRFGVEITEQHGQVTFTLKSEQLIPLMTALKEEFGFDMLELETAVDYWPQITPRFHMVYQVCSMKANQALRLRVPLDGNAPRLASLVSIYPAANWREREIWDLFGIQFEGHPDPRRILMPFDWEGHPLRKDYPLGYEEPQFTFNFEKIAGRKPHPRN